MHSNHPHTVEHNASPSTHRTPRHRRRCASTRTCPHADAPISAHRAGPHDATVAGNPPSKPMRGPAIEADAGARHRSRCGGLRQPGGHGGGTAPDPIPNSDVKPTSAYDTAPQGAGKSVAARSSEPPPPQPHRPTHTHTHPAAGWSSPVARQAHNLKVTGSNPVPATSLASYAGEWVTP